MTTSPDTCPGRAPSPSPHAAGAREEGAHGRGFERTQVWVFDLDNTLYPADCNLFLQVDQRMGEFIARLLGVPFAYARHLQKTYYRQFGTTLSGLMQVHGMDPKPFLDYVHEIDLTPVREHPELAAAIDKLPGRKLIFTNGSRRHAERVAGKLGVLRCFETIFDICDANYVPKPTESCYQHFCRAHGVDATQSAMFEDIPRNLEAPHALGMTTVLVRSNANDDHPVQQMIRAWVEPPAHVHHMTFDLVAFLGGLTGMRPEGSTRDVMDVPSNAELKGMEVNSQPRREGAHPPPADNKRTGR
jgi:putative hydrolase of the HAD superfamily